MSAVEEHRARVEAAREALVAAEALYFRAIQEAPDSAEPLLPDGTLKPGWHAISCDYCECQNYVRDDQPNVCPNASVVGCPRPA